MEIYIIGIKEASIKHKIFEKLYARMLDINMLKFLKKHAKISV